MDTIGGYDLLRLSMACLGTQITFISNAFRCLAVTVMESYLSFSY